jgi:hypothetical protein
LPWTTSCAPPPPSAAVRRLGGTGAGAKHARGPAKVVTADTKQPFPPPATQPLSAARSSRPVTQVASDGPIRVAGQFGERPSSSANGPTTGARLNANRLPSKGRRYEHKLLPAPVQCPLEDGIVLKLPLTVATGSGAVWLMWPVVCPPGTAKVPDAEPDPKVGSLFR